MAGQDPPADLLIILKIMDYLHARSTEMPSLDQPDTGSLLQIINNIAPGASLGMLFSNTQETTMGDHYQVSGQAGAVGREAQANDMTFNQIHLDGIDLSELAQQLDLLRSAMRQQAATPDDDVAVAEVGQAMVSADRGNRAEAHAHLERAGKWALDVATTIGTTVAAEAIKSTLGF